MKRLITLIALFVTVVCGSCARTREPTVPLRTLAIGADSDHDTLVVLLPGIRDVPEDFARPAFADRSNNFDLLAVDAHWGYYEARSIVDRLHEDVIEPARRGGYAQIWLVGISLGGFGALLYVDRFPNEIEGIVLLAPYLGEPALASAIEEAGGLDAWSKLPLPDSPFALGWRSVRNIVVRRQPSVVLGYGRTDPLAETYGPLLRSVPAQQVHTRRGGHRWSTWAPLWRTIEASGVLSEAHPRDAG